MNGRVQLLVRDVRLRGRLALSVLIALSALITLMGLTAGPRVAPVSLLNLPVVLGGVLLGRRAMAQLLIATAVGAVAILVKVGFDDFRWATLLLFAAVGWVGDRLATQRDELGVPTRRGGAMLVEVHRRLRQQSELPTLPSGWRAEISIRSADDAAFAGDFVVSSLQSSRLELAIVDVSGKGMNAGSRALLLSGAMGGLLGAVSPTEFLPASNDYLLRQQWNEGFATAAHLTVDLTTGDYQLHSAGHPPAAHFSSGAGYWTTSQAEGVALGLLDGPSWTPERGTLRRGDALLLVTDGVVEVSGRDLSVGIDKLLGEANRLVISSFEGGADRLSDAVAANSTDDRAVVLLWRQ